jgi:hypothetical protein
MDAFSIDEENQSWSFCSYEEERCLVIPGTPDENGKKPIYFAPSEIIGDAAAFLETLAPQDGGDALVTYADAVREVLAGRDMLETEPLEIGGEMCRVFGMGENSAERFVALEHFAISPTGKIYTMDIVSGEWLVFQPSGEIPQPSLQQIMDAYAAAEEAMGWFQMSAMPMDYSDADPYRPGGYAVNHPAIKTFRQLVLHLESLFSFDIVTSLVAASPYYDVGDKLYGEAGDRGGNIYKGEEKHEMFAEDDDTIIYRVIVDDLSDDLSRVVGQSTHDMVYEYVDGKWVFTRFELVR